MSDARKIISGVLLRPRSIDFRDDGAFIGPVHADAILAALADAGLVVVPREPTPDRIVKVLDALPSDWNGFMSEDIKELWSAMVEAANEQ